MLRMLFFNYVLKLEISSCMYVGRCAQFRANMALGDKAETKRLRWKAHDAAQLVRGLHVRKVRAKGVRFRRCVGAHVVVQCCSK